MPSSGARAEALGADWIDKQEELFGPAEALASTYRLLRDELMVGTAGPAGGSPSCGSIPIWTSRTRSCATWSC